MVRMLPKDDIGVWVLFTGITAILELLRNGFIRNPFIASLVSANDSDKKQILGASLTLHCILAGTVILLLISVASPLSSFWDAPGLDILFYIYALNSIVLIPFLHFEYIQHSQLNFKGIFISNFVRMSLLSIYIIVEFAFDVTPLLYELAIVQLIATILACFTSYNFVKNQHLLGKGGNKKSIAELFHFGKYTLGTTISSTFVKSTDTWMIARMISTSGVADYNPALRISSIVEVPTLAVASIIFPQVSKQMQEHGVEGVRDVYCKSVSLILALMVPMVMPLYIFSDSIIEIIFGKNYMEAAPILRVTIFYTLIIPFNRQFGTLMDALKMPKLNFYLLVMVAVLNVIFCYFFLNAYGTVGAAYGTLLSYCIVFVLNQIILYRKFKINTLTVLVEVWDWYKIGWRFLAKKILKRA